ncbi:MAG: hypothetical protein KBT47_00605, partial [Armatimonadetes bacterium]|nr:hypothetical protein [Candidatus Hippobium faecium]
MKKILCLCLILVFFSVFAYCQNNDTKRIERMVFGINESDYESLNLTDSQKEKISQLQKNYNTEYEKYDKANSNKTIDIPGLEKELTSQIGKQAKLLSDFKKILTKEQLAMYERAYFIKLSEQRVFLTKKFSAFEEPLELTDEQKTKVRKLVANYEGDLLALENDFVNILTDKQKIVYNHLKQRQLNQMLSKKTDQREGQETVKTPQTQETTSSQPQPQTTENKNVNVNINIEPVVWWAFSCWNPRPIHRVNVYIYDTYWDVYERRYVSWDYDRWYYESWRYEERIYEKGFWDGVAYEKWAEDPFDYDRGIYKDIKEYYNNEWTDYSDYDRFRDYEKDITKYNPKEDYDYCDKVYEDLEKDYDPDLYEDYDKTSDEDRDSDYSDYDTKDYDTGSSDTKDSDWESDWDNSSSSSEKDSYEDYNDY